MSKVEQRFKLPIPDGMQIYVADEEPAGLTHHLAAARAFALRKQHALEFRTEPGNKFDRNALCVIGHSKGWFLERANCIGYVRREYAAALAELGLIPSISPRLKNIWMGDNGFVTVRYDILGPKERHKEFLARAAAAAEANGP